MEKSKDPIGENLRILRESRGVSVPELAILLEIPKDRIYKWEQGASAPKFEDRKKVEEWMNGTWNKIPLKIGKPDKDQGLLAYERLIEAIEARRQDAANALEEAKKDKERLYGIIEKYLEGMSANLVTTKTVAEAGYREMQAEHWVMMEAFDTLLKQKTGTIGAKAGTVEQALIGLRGSDKTTVSDKSGKTKA